MTEPSSGDKSFRVVVRNRWNPSKEEMTAAKAELLSLCSDSVSLKMLFAIRSAFMQGNDRYPITLYSHHIEGHLRNADILRTFKTTPVLLAMKKILIFITPKLVTIPSCLVNALFVQLPNVCLAAELYRVLLDRPQSKECYDKLVEINTENAIFANEPQSEEENQLQEDWRGANDDMRYEKIAKVCIEYPKVFRLIYGQVSIIDPEQKYTVFLPNE